MINPEQKGLDLGRHKELKRAMRIELDEKLTIEMNNIKIKIV